MNTRRALVILDVLVALLILATLAAALAVVGQRQRRLAGATESIANLRQLASGHASYSADNADAVATFSWRTGVTPSSYNDLHVAATDIDAAAYQAVDIIRRRSGRPVSEFPVVSGWLPHVIYSHLIFADYLNQSLPLGLVASPGDKMLLGWRDGSIALPDTGFNFRYRYSSSYELPPAFYAPDASGIGNPSYTTIQQTAVHNSFQTPTPDTQMAHRKLTEVAFPAQKALMYERYQYFDGPRVTFAFFPEARVPVATVDGSVLMRRTSNTNSGFQPNSPKASLSITTFTYSPLAWEPPTGANGICQGYMRYTRSGLLGRDFDGSEVAWK